MYETRSSSSSGLPELAISSAKARIFPTYLDIERLPFHVVERAILVLTMHAFLIDENVASRNAQTSAVVLQTETWRRVSLDMLSSKYPSTY
jgi:hypothetical protein